MPSGPPIIQIVEPFDGVDHSYLITPLLGAHVQKLGYRVVHLVGRNSGPKFGNTVADIAKKLNFQFLTKNDDITDQRVTRRRDSRPTIGGRDTAAAGPADQSTGHYIHQCDLSSRLDRWVDRRREIIKRPYFATLEKFLNPCQARIIIASAFHPPYGEKMTTVAEKAGFPGSIVVRNGMEGTIAFPLKRSAKILCSTRRANGIYERSEFDFDPVTFLGHEVAVEEKWENPARSENGRLIQEFLTAGKSSYELFNDRVKTTCAGLEKAIRWVEERIDR